jgi:hypothetical protein
MGGVSRVSSGGSRSSWINTLSFSLAVGLAVSAFGVNERNVMLATLLCIAIATIGLPLCCYLALRNSPTRAGLEFLLLFPSPAYALKMSGAGLFVPVASDFWPCMFTVGGISLASVGIASIRLPHSFQEPNQALRADGRRSRTDRLTFGNDFLRASVRMRYLLSGRPISGGSAATGPRASCCSAHAGHGCVERFFNGVFDPPMLPPTATILLFGWLAVHWLFKLLVATEASVLSTKTNAAGRSNSCCAHLSGQAI